MISFKNLINQYPTRTPTSKTAVGQPEWLLKTYPVESEPLLNKPTHVQQVQVLQSVDSSQIHHTKNGLFHKLFEQQVDSLGYRGARRSVAVEYPGESYHYAALEKLANRIAHYMQRNGVKPQDRIGLLFDRSIYSYACTLAVMKAGATFVPLDAAFPTERIDYMLKDSGVKRVLTVSSYMGILDSIDCPAIAVDAERESIDKMPAKRLTLSTTLSTDALCYVIYTSGSTGRPKGVLISHANICAFLGSARHCYGYHSTDRVYQALTQAFDYSIEEIWLPLLCCATLVPAPQNGPLKGNLAGEDLSDFLQTNKITALCCVPTLLATVEHDLPTLRFLMVSGEACPQTLIDKWACDGRRFLNTYGPTETTVSATWQVINPDTKVTIGGPLPGYSVVILKPHRTVAVKPGESGEICIAGKGVSAGYLNLPEQTQSAFINDFIGIKNNPGATIYRTGDLGLINQSNEIQYHGRIDSQIKIRGYRIELNEIESVLGAIENLSEVVVCAKKSNTDQQELVAYYTTRPTAQTVTATEIQNRLRNMLPSYMVPDYYQALDTMPHLPSGKIDRKKLPAPQGHRLLASGKPYCEPGTALESQLADIMAGIMDTDRISIKDDFFDDLSANSLLMAKFVARIRRTLSIKGISLKIVYQNPTIASLAIIAEQALLKSTARKNNVVVPLDNIASQSNAATKTLIDNSISSRTGDVSLITNNNNQTIENNINQTSKHNHQRDNTDNPTTESTSAVACGVMQCGVFCCYLFLISLAGFISFNWLSNAGSIENLYQRAIITSVCLFFGSAALLIAVKWLAVGRFQVQVFPIWGTRYLRFWIARTAILANPLNMFRGTPLYNVFLRLLGAKIGRQAIIFSRPPVCCDLVSIGHNAVIREDVFNTAYSAEAGVIRTGTVEVGNHCYIGEASVLDINTGMGDFSQLGHASALTENQHIPEQQRFHGSPAEPATTDYDHLPKLPTSNLRRLLYSLFQLTAYVMIAMPLLTSILLTLAQYAAWPSTSGDNTAVISVLATLATSTTVFYLAGTCTALASVLIIPRLILPFMQEDTTHPVYGWQFYLGQTMSRFSNSRLLNWLFGDSSMILHYLSAIGYDMTDATQTGSNFGVDQRQHSPFHCRFGRNTLVSDRLRMMNMQVSTSAYKISSISVPADMYLGNSLHYPVGARLSENCLIGTKTMIPIDGPLHTNTGILGSPAFQIPRSVASDHRFDHYLEPTLLKQRLKLKLKSNLVTLAMYITKSWLQIFLALVMAWAGALFYQSFSHSSTLLQAAIATVVAVTDILIFLLFSIFCERLAQGFRALKPLYCSLYDRRFWQHERFWKMNSNPLLELFNGTPIKPVFNRLRGVKIGVNMFDDGVAIVEHDLVNIGDNCTFNVNSVAQSHSLEDGTFKSDHITIGNSCNFGVSAFIHYGTVVQDNCTVLADSFVMKGAITGENTRWGGNPACELLVDDIVPTPLPTNYPAAPKESIAGIKHENKETALA